MSLYAMDHHSVELKGDALDVHVRVCSFLPLEPVPCDSAPDQIRCLPVLGFFGVHFCVAFGYALALLIGEFHFVGSVTQGHQTTHDGTDGDNKY